MLNSNRRRPKLSILLPLGVLLTVTIPAITFGQGCVASRGSGLSGAHQGMSADDVGDEGVDVSLGYRWFRSDRHFVGDVEQVQRQQQHSQVINDQNFFDLGIAYAINRRIRLTVTLPFATNSRSQAVRANGVLIDRFETHTAGIGDLRVTADVWLRDPSKELTWNVLLGAGVSAPTGNDAGRDVFEVYDAKSGRVLAQQRPVDESIQLGIGGWGIPLELFAYKQVSSYWQTYLEGAYTITPQNTNGVATFRSNPYEAVNSVADFYMGRLGVDYEVVPAHHVHLSLGGRIDGVPVRDLIGRSEGFRRPGYAVAIEPGVSASAGSWSFSIFAPVAVYRNRLQSVSDKELTAATGVYQHGDAAFTDFSIISNISKRW
jgi:hypothetical protein